MVVEGSRAGALVLVGSSTHGSVGVSDQAPHDERFLCSLGGGGGFRLVPLQFSEGSEI